MAIDKIRLQNGEEYELEEWLHWPLYSVVEGAAGASVNLRAFSYVVGNNVPQAGAISTGARAATDADTNQVVRGKVNHDEAFIVFSMTNEWWAIEGSTNQDSTYAVAPFDNSATAPLLSGTNLRLIQLYMMQQLFVGAGISKPMASAPMEYFGQGIGAVAYGSGDALTIANGGASALNLNYGTAGPINPTRNQRGFAMPILVHSDRVMHVRLSTPAGALTVDQDWRTKVILDGMKRRPVA